MEDDDDGRQGPISAIEACLAHSTLVQGDCYHGCPLSNSPEVLKVELPLQMRLSLTQLRMTALYE